MDLTTATPVEIDTVLAGLYAEQNRIGNTIASEMSTVMHYAGAKRSYGRTASWSMSSADAEAKVRAAIADETMPSWDRRGAASALAKIDEAREALAAVHAEQRRIGEEFRNRGGWTRAYLVTDGHVHSSMNCASCNKGETPTSFTWLVEFAAKTEAEIIEAAADRACTVCYPNAPVETAGPSALMTPDERTRAEQREEAAKAKDARLAKRIADGLTADGSEFKVTYRGFRSESREHFKTERAAVQWMVQRIVWGEHGDEDYAPAFNAIIDAVATKHGQSRDEVMADLNKKIAAKCKRDGQDAPRYDVARLSA